MDRIRARVVANLMVEDAEVALAQAVLASEARDEGLSLHRLGNVHHLGDWESFLDQRQSRFRIIIVKTFTLGMLLRFLTGALLRGGGDVVFGEFEPGVHIKERQRLNVQVLLALHLGAARALAGRGREPVLACTGLRERDFGIPRIFMGPLNCAFHEHTQAVHLGQRPRLRQADLQRLTPNIVRTEFNLFLLLPKVPLTLLVFGFLGFLNVRVVQSRNLSFRHLRYVGAAVQDGTEGTSYAHQGLPVEAHANSNRRIRCERVPDYV